MWVNPLTTNVPYHIETSQLICGRFIYDENYWSLMVYASTLHYGLYVFHMLRVPSCCYNVIVLILICVI